MSLREEAPPPQDYGRAILPAAHVVPKGCKCSINPMRTLSVAHWLVGRKNRCYRCSRLGKCFMHTLYCTGVQNGEGNWPCLPTSGVPVQVIAGGSCISVFVTKGCFMIVLATGEHGDCEQVPRNVVAVIIVCEFWGWKPHTSGLFRSDYW